MNKDLKQQNTRLDFLAKTLMELSPLGIYIVQDREFKIVSPEFTRIVGYQEEELRMRHPLSIVHPENRELVREAATMMLKGKRHSPYQFRVITRNGSERWILERVASIEFQGGRATLGNFMDITEQVRMHKALRENEALLDAVLSSSPLGIAMVEDMIIRWSNPSMATMLGYGEKEDLIGKEVRMFVPSQKEWNRISEAIERMLVAERRGSVDGKFVRRGGEIFDGMLSLAPLGYPGNSNKFVSILSDITRRKQAEAQLAAERERLAVTLRSIGDGVICTDQDGKIVLMNKVAEELTGYTEAEARGRSLHEVFRIIDELSRKPHEDLVNKVLKEGKSIELTEGTLLITKDGTERLIGDSIAPVKDGTGDTIGAILVFRDLTTKRALELELTRTQKLEAVGVLAGGIAHDFNNMLMGILGYITLAKMSIGSPQEALESLRKAEQGCMRAKALSQKLITFSTGGEPVKEVDELSGVICDSVEFALTGSNVRAEYEVDDSLCKVAFDRGQVEQVIHNIVANAVDAMPGGGKIVVKAHNIEVKAGDGLAVPEGSYVRICIKDQGPGMTKENQERAFDPFFTTKEAGRGLGLSIAHSIVKRHGGQIKLHSEHGSGTEVQIYLPEADDTACGTNHGQFKIPRARVLLMDDDAMVREVTANLLKHLGVDVELAQDGQQAVELYSKAVESGRPFEAAILDLTVPGGMGGKEAMEKLLEMDPKVKGIVASGYCDDPVMDDYVQYGFKARLTKPYKMDELANVIGKILKEN